MSSYDESGLIYVDGKSYLVDDIAKNHPGGPLFIKMFAGKDATDAFLTYHRKPFPSHRVDSSWTGGTATSHTGPYDDYLSLCAEVEKVVPRNKSFAPYSYFIKISSILGSALWLEYYMHSNTVYVWYLSAILGWLYALIGLNIQHDANHGAISRHFWINRILGLTQNWIGGSSISWYHQHVVQHHIHTNDVVLDPDISGTKLLRLNPLRSWFRFYSLQYIYFFFLISLYGCTAIFDFIGDAWNGTMYTPMSPLLLNERRFDLICSLGFLVRWIIYPIYVTKNIYTIFHILPMMTVAGYYLAFFFILSHNFLGTTFHSVNHDDNQTTSLLYRQVSSSCNVGGSWLCFSNGGLNYQIEHHLFPRMNHTHYPIIAPIVKQFCKTRGIPYVHYPTVWDNLQSTISHLKHLGYSSTKY